MNSPWASGDLCLAPHQALSTPPSLSLLIAPRSVLILALQVKNWAPERLKDLSHHSHMVGWAPVSLQCVQQLNRQTLELIA